MRHHNQNRKFGRESAERRALLRSLAEALIARGKIRTTEAKAKELRPFVEKLVTRARIGTLASRRLVMVRLGGAAAAKPLLDIIAPRYQKRPGGYTRITKLPPRRADGARLAVIEFV